MRKYTKIIDILCEVTATYLKTNSKKLELYGRNQKTFFLFLGYFEQKYQFILYSERNEKIASSQRESIVKLKEDLSEELRKVGFLEKKEIEFISSYDEYDDFSEASTRQFELDTTQTFRVNYTKKHKDKDEIDQIYLNDCHNIINVYGLDKNEKILFQSSQQNFIDVGLSQKGSSQNIGLETKIKKRMSSYINDKRIKKSFEISDMKKYLLEVSEVRFNNIPQDLAFLTITNRNIDTLKNLIDISKKFRKGNLREVPHFVFYRSGNINISDINILNQIGQVDNIYFQELSSLSNQEKIELNKPFGTNKNSNVGADRRDSLLRLDNKYKNIITFDDNITGISYIPEYTIEKGNQKKSGTTISIFKDINLYRKFIGEVVFKDYDFLSIPSGQQFFSIGLSPISKITTGFLKFRRDDNINFLPLSLSEDRDFGLQYLVNGKEVVISDIFFFNKKGSHKESGVGSSVYKNREYLNKLCNFFEERYKQYSLSGSIRKGEEGFNLNLSCIPLLKGIKYQK